MNYTEKPLLGQRDSSGMEFTSILQEGAKDKDDWVLDSRQTNGRTFFLPLGVFLRFLSLALQLFWLPCFVFILKHFGAHASLESDWKQDFLSVSTVWFIGTPVSPR